MGTRVGGIICLGWTHTQLLGLYSLLLFLGWGLEDVGSFITWHDKGDSELTASWTETVPCLD